MASNYPQFNGFSLQSDNVITSDIEYRTSPNKTTNTSPISRRAGVKLTSNQFAERHIKLKGYVMGNDPSDLRNQMDQFNQYVVAQDIGQLYIESDRYASAVMSSIAIGDMHYNQSIVPFDADFLLTDPFFYGVAQVINFPVVSGVLSISTIITISGSAFAEPSITYFAPSLPGGLISGYTTTSGILIGYSLTGEVLTWSGTGGNITTLDYGDSITFDYANHLIDQGNTPTAIEGAFARWQPGVTPFTITFSGAAQGGTVQFAYQPRYL